MSQDFTARHEGETTVYTGCICNYGSDSQGVFKAHVKDGIITAVAPDDRYNTGIGREDEVLSEEELIKTHLQRRQCTWGLVFHGRVLHPLKRDPGSKYEEGKYTRISWDEALTTIADRMKAIKERYGPYSMIIPIHAQPGSSTSLLLLGSRHG